MNDAYRDEKESLHARIQELEAGLSNRDAELEELRQRSSDQNAVFTRLQSVLDRGAEPARRRWPFVAGTVIAALGILGGSFGLARSRSLPPAPKAVAAQNAVPAALPAADPCARPGVRLSLGGEDAEALASGDRDLAGHKYRRDGSRSPWLTVEGGPLYVHAVGDFLHGDVGTTQLSLLTIITKGETAGYRLARGGKSVVEVMSSDGKHVSGRFEADVSKVADTTREPPFGTPVVRVRGTFCLPAVPADPTDTGP
jgi:hypothetical protein